MATYKTKANVADNGTLTIFGLPFKSGEQVEVSIEPIEEAQEEKERYPLRASRTSTSVRLTVWRLTSGECINSEPFHCCGLSKQLSLAKR